MLALRQLARRNPLVPVGVPEQVAAGGVDDLGAGAGLDGEVVQVGVVVDQDSGDGLGLVLAGPGVSGEDLVSRLELADRDRLARGEQDQRAGGERVPALGGVGGAVTAVLPSFSPVAGSSSAGAPASPVPVSAPAEAASSAPASATSSAPVLASAPMPAAPARPWPGPGPVTLEADNALLARGGTFLRRDDFAGRFIQHRAATASR